MFFDRSVSDQQRGWEWPLWSPNWNPLRVSNSRLYKTMYLLYILKFCGKHFGWFSSWLKACAGHGRKRWKILFGIWFLCWQLLLCLQPKKMESMAKKTDLWKRPSEVIISNFKFLHVWFDVHNTVTELWASQIWLFCEASPQIIIALITGWFPSRSWPYAEK